MGNCQASSTDAASTACKFRDATACEGPVIHNIGEMKNDLANKLQYDYIISYRDGATGNSKGETAIPPSKVACCPKGSNAKWAFLEAVQKPGDVVEHQVYCCSSDPPRYVHDSNPTKTDNDPTNDKDGALKEFNRTCRPALDRSANPRGYAGKGEHMTWPASATARSAPVASAARLLDSSEMIVAYDAGAGAGDPEADIGAGTGTALEGGSWWEDGALAEALGAGGDAAGGYALADESALADAARHAAPLL
eukprot:tig00000076_g2336.t1